MRSNTFVPLVMLTVFALVSQDVHAQANRGNRNQNRNLNMNSDTGFIRRQIMSNQREIRFARMAIDKAGEESVKTLARQMVIDHREVLSNLVAVGRKLDMKGLPEGAGRSPMAKKDSLLRDTSMTGTKNDTVINPHNRAGETIEQADMEQQSPDVPDDLDTSDSDSTMAEMDSSRVAGNLARLNSLSGGEFEKGWIQQMLRMHEMKINQLNRALPRLKDSQLKNVVNSALPKIQAHRDQLSRMASANESGSNNR